MAAGLTVAPFSPTPDTALAAKLDEYLDWTIDALHLDGAAIVDPDGLVIAARSLDEPDVVVATGIDPMLRYVRDLFEYDDLVDDSPGNRPGTVSSDERVVDTMASQRMIQIDGFLALRLGRRHLGAVWTETNFGRFYGLLSLRDAAASEVLEQASDGFRTLFAD